MAQHKIWGFEKKFLPGPCILIVGVLGIIWGLMATPDKFPTVSLYLAAIGSVLSIVIPQNS